MLSISKGSSKEELKVFGKQKQKQKQGVPRESLGTPLFVSTPVGDSVVVDWIYWSYIVTFCCYETRADLLLRDMTDFEVIRGMDWLSPCQVVLYFHAKTVTLPISELPRLEWKGSTVNASSQDTAAETLVIDSMPMVWEFYNVFPSDLPGMPLDRDIDFCIDLALGTQPISIPPDHMAPKELKELKEQL
ncbi:uncharacterized protein [Nicotiana sylvestris]|uniref:uncharacterized protein n=1 Tax=Nicotiana sylvestris TaxID=4096 RepID=UPI00388CE5BD